MKYLSPLNNIRYQILFIFHISLAFNSFLLHYYVDFLKIWQIKLDFLDHLISTFNFVRLVLCPSFFLNAQFLKCMCFELTLVQFIFKSNILYFHMILSVIHDVFRIQCIFNSNKLSIQKVRNNEMPYIGKVINQRFI